MIKNYVKTDLKKITKYVDSVGEEIAKLRLCHKCWRKYLKEKRNTQNIKK